MSHTKEHLEVKSNERMLELENQYLLKTIRSKELHLAVLYAVIGALCIGLAIVL